MIVLIKTYLVDICALNYSTFISFASVPAVVMQVGGFSIQP